MSKPKLLIFDWDDVFTLGSKEGYHACLRAAVSGVGVTLDPEIEQQRISENWGKPHPEELKALLREHPHLVPEAIRIYEKTFFEGGFVRHLTYLTGSNQLLNRLAKDYTLALATGAHPEILFDQIMPKFNVPDVFSKVISTYELDDPEKSKPHPYMVNQIMAELGFEPDETWFIGDAESDVLSAQAANVEPVVVLTGRLDRKAAKELNVTKIIDDVTKLFELLS